MVELVDTIALEAVALTGIEVRVLLRAFGFKVISGAINSVVEWPPYKW